MGANDRGKLPRDLARGRSRLQAWRGRRKSGGRIPQSLWALAVELVSRHGVSCHRALQMQPVMGASKPAAVQRFTTISFLLLRPTSGVNGTDFIR
jgi:hypothetical protein